MGPTFTALNSQYVSRTVAGAMATVGHHASQPVMTVTSAGALQLDSVQRAAYCIQPPHPLFMEPTICLCISLGPTLGDRWGLAGMRGRPQNKSALCCVDPHLVFAAADLRTPG